MLLISLLVCRGCALVKSEVHSYLITEVPNYFKKISQLPDVVRVQIDILNKKEMAD